MKLIKYCLIAMVLCSAVQTASAQLELAGLTGGRGAILFTGSSRGMDIFNPGLTDSPDYTFKVSVSTDNDFDASKVVFEMEYPPIAAGATVDHRYSYPVPAPTDNRLLSEIISSGYFLRFCIEIGGVTIQCSDSGETVSPPETTEPKASLGVRSDVVEIDYTVETRNGEIPFDFLRVDWTDRALDGGPTGVLSMIEIPLNELLVIDDGQNQKTFRVMFDQSTPGVPGSFLVRGCFNAVPGVFQCGPGPLPDAQIGYRSAVALATQGELSDRIRVEWPRFALNQNFNAYIVTRCERDRPASTCVESKVMSSGPVESFEDFQVTRGAQYTYTVDACEGLNPATCVVEEYVNVAQSEAAFVGLIDEFEDDNSAAQATLVTENTEQLHSFHTVDDEDWLELRLQKPGKVVIQTSAFRNENVDTTLALFDSNEKLITQNIDEDPLNAPESFSRIETEILPAGTYFIKAAAFSLPIPGFPGELANNYNLTVTLVGSQVILAPVIDLILN